MKENVEIDVFSSRYQRQLTLPQFGIEAQKKLSQSKVFVAGAGGLGSPVCLYLAAAGVGHLVVCDKDQIDLSNLNRQILHGTNNIGKAKSDSAFTSLANLNPEIVIETHNTSIDDDNIAQIAYDADIIVDCLDNIATRKVINRYSIAQGIPIMHAGIDGWNGQLTLIEPPKTPCINCLFLDNDDNDEPKPVLGAVAGIIGTTQALETIKFLIGMGSSLKNNLLYFDALNMDWTKVKIEKNAQCEVCNNL